VPRDSSVPSFEEEKKRISHDSGRSLSITRLSNGETSLWAPAQACVNRTRRNVANIHHSQTLVSRGNRIYAEAAAISLTEEGHKGKTYDLVSSEMLTGPDAAATWSKLLGKEITYAGHGDFDGFEAQLRKTGSPSWLAYDLRVMFQGYVERGFSNTEDQTARVAALLGHQPRTYSSFAEELAKEWAAAR
jgi:hypothetical protein